jgi:hypothetical protein
MKCILSAYRIRSKIAPRQRTPLQTESCRLSGNSRQINRKNAAAAWHVTHSQRAVVCLNAASADIEPQSEPRPAFTVLGNGFNNVSAAAAVCSLENIASDSCVRYRTQLRVFIVLNYTFRSLKGSTRPHSNRPSKFEEGLPYRSFKHGTLDESQCLARRKS